MSSMTAAATLGGFHPQAIGALDLHPVGGRLTCTVDPKAAAAK